MTLDWPTVAALACALAFVAFALRVTLPYVVGQSSERARAAALKSVNERLDKVEGALMQGRKMPGRL